MGRTKEAALRLQFKLAVIAAIVLLLAAQLVVGLLLAQQAYALTTETVDSLTDDGWSKADTRANGHVEFVEDATAPLGTGALSLKTDTSPAASQDKAQFMLPANVPLADVVAHPLYYSTKQNSASFVAGLPSYQLPVNLLGANGGFTTLVYEPYVSEGNNAVVNGQWQQWNVGEGKLWSTRAVGSLQPSQGTYTYTLSQILAEFPDAVVLGAGVNVGSNNPGYDTAVDGLAFNDKLYNFDPAPVAPAVPGGLGFVQAITCGGATKLGTATFTWGSVTGAESYTYRIERPIGAAIEATVTGTNAPAFGLTTQGQYSFKVRANGTNGLKSDWSPVCTVKYDTTAPTVTISSSNFMVPRGDTLTVAGTTSTDTTAIDIRMDGVSIGAATIAPNGNWTFSIPMPASIQIGKAYVVTAVATDAAGNSRTATSYAYFINAFPWF